MPSGTFTITAGAGNRTISRTVTLPAAPTMMRDVVLGATTPAVQSTAVQQHGAFRVAVGAFRLPENAAAARRKIERLGGHAEIMRNGSLDLVTVGPFASREAAKGEAARLRAANVEAVVVADRVTPPAAAPRVSNGPHVVQAGAFREERNARQLLGRLERNGEKPFTVATHSLTLVYLGPFETREEAAAASERLRREGFDGFVTRR
jgi:cell division protein FtsN